MLWIRVHLSWYLHWKSVCVFAGDIYTFYYSFLRDNWTLSIWMICIPAFETIFFVSFWPRAAGRIISELAAVETSYLWSWILTGTALFRFFNLLCLLLASLSNLALRLHMTSWRLIILQFFQTVGSWVVVVRLCFRFPELSIILNLHLTYLIGLTSVSCRNSSLHSFRIVSTFSPALTRITTTDQLLIGMSTLICSLNWATLTLLILSENHTRF